MNPVSFQWPEPPDTVRIDLLDAPAFVSKDGRLLLLLPRSPADAKGPGSAPDSRQVLDWATGRLGFVDSDAMVVHFSSVRIMLDFQSSIRNETYPLEVDDD